MRPHKYILGLMGPFIAQVAACGEKTGSPDAVSIGNAGESSAANNSWSYHMREISATAKIPPGDTACDITQTLVSAKFGIEGSENFFGTKRSMRVSYDGEDLEKNAPFDLTFVLRIWCKNVEDDVQRLQTEIRVAASANNNLGTCQHNEWTQNTKSVSKPAGILYLDRHEYSKVTVSWECMKTGSAPGQCVVL